MQVLGQSIVKANNDIYEGEIHRVNEDALLIKENCIAISDGAGGVGILADLWSKELVQNIPNKPFNSITELDEWLNDFWEGFYTGNLPKLKDDPWKLKKFESEGSQATLSVLWKIESNQYIYQSYGDSTLFVYNTKTGGLEIQKNIKSINYFGSHPYLINWKVEKHFEEGFFEQRLDLEIDEEIIMATDGIAMYIFGAYMVYSNSISEEVTESKMLKIVDYFKENPISDFREFMAELKSSLANKGDFQKLTSNWYKNRALDNDDYTLVWMEMN
jgi:hypothetical protein